MPPATSSRPRAKAVRLSRMKPLRLHEVTNPPAAAAARRRQVALQSAQTSAKHTRPDAALPPAA